MSKKRKTHRRNVVTPQKRYLNRSLRIGAFLRTVGKALALIFLCAGFVFLLSWVGLLDLLRIDAWVERKFITYANAFTYEDINQDVVLITAVEDEQGNGTLGKPDHSWRSRHAQLLNSLSQAQAKVIAFDLFFEDSSPSDQAFAEAINNATERGTTVVVGVRKFNVQQGVPTPFLTPVLQNNLKERNWGFLEGGGVDRDTASVRKLKLASAMNNDLPAWVEAQQSRVVPSFALQVMNGGLLSHAGTTIYEKNAGQIRLATPDGRVVRSIPVDENLNFIIDEKETAALDKINHPYHEVYNNLENLEYLRNFFSGKIIIIGYKDKEDLRTIINGESRYGVQIQANVVSDLLQGVYISKLRAVFSFLVLLAMSSIGFVVGTRFRHRLRYKIPIEMSLVKVHIDLPILLFLISAAYLIIAVLLYKYHRVLLGMPYHVVVLFLTFGLADQFENRKKSPQR